jgi:CRP/FNR family transcriptional regulator, dissimilatory nitrate respiration regulator
MIDLLQGVRLFRHFTPEQTARIARKAREINLAAGEILFMHGAPADCFFYLVKGQLKLYRVSPDGHEKIVEVLEAGCTFAETRVFLERPHYHVSCAALLDSEIIGIDAKNFVAVLRDSVDTCLMLLGEFSQRLDGLVNEIDRLSLQDAASRVAEYLYRRLPRDADQFVLKVPKGVLASRLSVRAETLSRILRHLAEGGTLSIDGRGVVTVQDREKLRQLAGGYGIDAERGQPLLPHRG